MDINEEGPSWNWIWRWRISFWEWIVSEWDWQGQMINNNTNLYSLKKLLIYIIYKEMLDRLLNKFSYNIVIFFVSL